MIRSFVCCKFVKFIILFYFLNKLRFLISRYKFTLKIVNFLIKYLLFYQLFILQNIFYLMIKIKSYFYNNLKINNAGKLIQYLNPRRLISLRETRFNRKLKVWIHKKSLSDFISATFRDAYLLFFYTYIQ